MDKNLFGSDFAPENERGFRGLRHNSGAGGYTIGMKESVRKVVKDPAFLFCAVGLAVTIVLGSVSHFFFEWSGKKPWVGVLFPANESVWEHLKLTTVPILLCFAGGFPFLKTAKNGAAAALLSTLSAAGVIVGGFYAYTAIAGESILPIDIALFVIGAAGAWVVAWFVLKAQDWGSWNFLCFLGLIGVLYCYTTFTLRPPEIFLFRTPEGSYGLPKA